MDISQKIFNAQVMHRRLFPKKNIFNYRLYYLALPLPAEPLPGKLIQFDAKDAGYRDGSDPEHFAKTILSNYGFNEEIKHITLITMPRVMGYVFNPVMFYWCVDDQRQLRAVIAEVHNTFGEQHCYLCAHEDRAAIESYHQLYAKKLFHVSPFLERNGYYRFRFSLSQEKLGIWIDYFNQENNKQLSTAFTGTLTTLNKSSLRKALWTHPLLTLRAITLIHWQALKLMKKRIRYMAKPEQSMITVSATQCLEERNQAKKRYSEQSSHVV